MFTKTTIRAEGAAGAAARRFVAGALLDRGFPNSGIEQAVLLTSEAVSSHNAQEGTDVHVSVVADPAMARVEVCNRHSAGPAVGAMDSAISSELRLRIIEELAEAWGVEQVADEKLVWFEVRP